MWRSCSAAGTVELKETDHIFQTWLLPYVILGLVHQWICEFLSLRLGTQWMKKNRSSCNTSWCLGTSLLHVFFDHYASKWRHFGLIVHKHSTDQDMLHYFLEVTALKEEGCGTSGVGLLHVTCSNAHPLFIIVLFFSGIWRETGLPWNGMMILHVAWGTSQKFEPLLYWQCLTGWYRL